MSLLYNNIILLNVSGIEPRHRAIKLVPMVGCPLDEGLSLSSYINGIVNFNKNISNKPCQCRNTDYWANDLLKVHQQRYRLSNNNKNVDIKFRAHHAFLVRLCGMKK